MIVFDADFISTTLLPTEGKAILVVDPNAIPSGLIPFHSSSGEPPAVSAKTADLPTAFRSCSTPFAARGTRRSGLPHLRRKDASAGRLPRRRLPRSARPGFLW